MKKNKTFLINIQYEKDVYFVNLYHIIFYILFYYFYIY
jgi:hypothetical protein